MDSTHSLHTLRWQPLQPGDLEAMYALHLSSIAGMAPQTVKPESRDFLHSLLNGRGRVVGAWQDEALVAYGVLQHTLPPYDDPRALLGLAPGARVWKLAGAAVAPAWRGQGLQRALIARRMAWAEGATLFSTAAPGNPPSWRSLLACGFEVRALQYLYGGHARYLLAHMADTADTPHERAKAPVQELPADALVPLQALLVQGWRGVAPGAAPGSLRLVQRAGQGAP